MKKNILITGQPGIGKTTLIKRLAEELKDLCPIGFYTEEIREQGMRKGFDLISFSGTKGILSHVSMKSPHRVGKYGVDTIGFEHFLHAIPFFDTVTKLVIIDEIGKMECFSHAFKTIIRDILDSDKMLLASIAFKGSGLIAEIKKRNDIRIFEITRNNRNSIFMDILDSVKQ